MTEKPKKAALAAKKAASKPKIPAAPTGLKEPGKRLWKSTHEELPGGFVFDGRERRALESACTLADRFAQLNAAIDSDGVTVAGSTGQVQVHPALAEARQTAAAIRSLLDGLEIPNASGVPESAQTIRARKAAQTRWNKSDTWSREAALARRANRG